MNQIHRKERQTASGPKRLIVFLISLFVIAALLVSAGLSAGNTDASAKAASARLNKAKQTMRVGDTFKLKLLNNREKVKWTSGNKQVATVSSKGKVKAKKPGTAVISAKVNNQKYRCTVTVLPGKTEKLEEEGVYTGKDEVALYIHTYHRLPSNFITKDQARALGWSGGSLHGYTPDKCIGGDVFFNYEGTLPKKEGRTYYECDINTLGADSRSAERLVYSSDGLIYYTKDHYNTFELLYE